MAEIEDFEAESKRKAALGVPRSQSFDAWVQQTLAPWQLPIAFGPFVLLIVMAQFPVADSIPSGLYVGLVIVAVTWAVVFEGYLLYLNYQK